MKFVRQIGCLGILIAWIVSGSAFAQSCKERFIKAATLGNGEGDYRQIVTQKIDGVQTETVHEFAMKSHHHWLVKPIEPAGIGWTLLHGGAMYSSLDEGETWREVSKFDEKAAEAARNQQKSDVGNVVELDCGQEQIDGQLLDRIHGQYEVSVGFKSTQVHTYWIEPDSDLIVRSDYQTISPTFKSTVTQKMISFEDAVVPVP